MLNSLIQALCLLGDFNCVHKASERVGIKGQDTGGGEKEEFNVCIEGLGLIDLPMVGKSYTWYRPNGSARNKIDKVLVSMEWFAVWPRSTQFVLERNVSDHCLIVVKTKLIDWGPRPFKVLDCWFEDKIFEKTVKEIWKA